MDLARSPLAPAAFPSLPDCPGLAPFVGKAGLRYLNRPDVLLWHFPKGAVVAGVTTTSHTASAAVQQCRLALASEQTATALLVHAGNSIACTGAHGVRVTEKLCAELALRYGCTREQLYYAATGVIGEPLPEEKVLNAMGKLSPASWEQAAQAICTTDTFLKGATATFNHEGQTYHISGIAKGSGMIEPDMATMLAFLSTEARVNPREWQQALAHAVDESFHCLTVDSDTSTSDTVLAFATGQGDPVPLASYQHALTKVCRKLAEQIARDGEGAQKLITVTVNGAANKVSARQVAKAVANSPLVKTAIAGEDANWGRIAMAVGKAKVPFDQNKLSIAVGGVAIVEAGQKAPAYNEAQVTTHLKGREISIEVDIAVGTDTATVWTCDLTHGYIKINADYRS